MYNININHRLGDYVKVDEKIYQLVNINVDLYFNEQYMRDIAVIKYLAVDAINPWGPLYSLPAGSLQKTTPQEVDDYILGDDNLDELFGGNFDDDDDDSDDFDEFEPEMVHDFDSTTTEHTTTNLKGAGNAMRDEKISKVRTVDDVLDEKNTVELLIKIIGDENGEYKEILEGLKAEFEEFATQKSNS